MVFFSPSPAVHDDYLFQQCSLISHENPRLPPPTLPPKKHKKKSTLSKVKVQEIIIAPPSKKKSGLLNP